VRPWCLVHAQTGREALADLNLRRQDYQTFYPRVRCTVRHARQLRTVERALFPSYLFVALDPLVDRWRPINGTLGVLRLVTHAFTPSLLPTGLVEALMRTCDEAGLVERAPDFAPGDRVRLISGPFAEQIGEVIAMPAADRVKLLLSMLSAKIEVSAPRAVCERAPPLSHAMA
jgi:transcription elongation factor/antiterminator RfaH